VNKGAIEMFMNDIVPKSNDWKILSPSVYSADVELKIKRDFFFIYKHLN
jgi:hypothetical protein